MLILAGCQKGLFENKGGREVTFTATAGVSTKAAYGDAVGNLQRIDWQADDEIVIFSDKAVNSQGNTFAPYKINGETISASGATSRAQLTGEYENVLRYIDEDQSKYQFVGVYPSSGTNYAEGKVTVRSTIPSEQVILGNGFPDMKNGTQLLSNPVKVDCYSPVSLNFAPNFTSFEFTLAAEKTMSLEGFTVTSDSNVLHGGYTSEIDLNATSPKWNTTVENGDGRKFIQVTFNNPLEMTLPEGGTKTNEVKFGFYTFPIDVTGLTFTFHLAFKEGEETVRVDRKLKVTYAKTEGGHTQGAPVNFVGGKKHNITGIVIPANLSDEVVIDLAVIPWDDASEDPYTITYGPDAVVNALALEYASGAANTGTGRRTNNNFAEAAVPINAYFSVFSPADAQWKIKVTGATDKLLVSADNITPTTTDDGVLELTGATGGRVHFKIQRAEGASATDQIQLNFYVVLNGREISMNSEITRGGALTITGKVGQ